MLSHLEEKMTDNYHSNLKNKQKYVAFEEKKYIYDNAPQIKPTF